MPENFNFSKIEDQQKFENLPEKEREEVVGRAQEEVAETQEKLRNTFGMASKEWQSFFVTFENARKEVLKKISNLDEKREDIYRERINNKLRESFSSVDDSQKYLAYHKSIAGSIGPIDAPKLDFEGEHSLLKFYQNLSKEITGIEVGRKFDEKIDEVIRKLENKYKVEELFWHQVASQLRSLKEIFHDVGDVKGKRILDLGCGSIRGSFDVDVLNKTRENELSRRMFEPWFCRALVELGAKPVGIDIGDNDGEEFEHYKIDLSKPGALDFLPDKSFDGINMRLFLSSPQLESMTSRSQRSSIREEIEKQVKRLLKDDGKIIDFDNL